MRKLIFLTILVFPTSFAWAYAAGEFFVDPHFAIGYNADQGGNFNVGLDAGMGISENMAGGVGAYYSAGEQPEHDRELGAGPFVVLFQPFTSFLVGQVREEINYVDMRRPVRVSSTRGTTYTHTNESGVASVTSVSLHVGIMQNITILGGYRFVLGLTNSDLGKDRSGTFLGVAIGF